MHWLQHDHGYGHDHGQACTYMILSKKWSVTENTAFNLISKESTGNEPLRGVLLKSLPHWHHAKVGSLSFDCQPDLKLLFVSHIFPAKNQTEKKLISEHNPCQGCDGANYPHYRLYRELFGASWFQI